MNGIGDPRAKLKSIVRKYPRLSEYLQWILDPAFTPRFLIDRWIKRQRGIILNFGSGSRKPATNVINIDIEKSANVHVVNQSNIIPFQSNTFDACLLEYVIEHVQNVQSLIREVLRVLKPGGQLLITVPFRQSYHACPKDYWRFTEDGLRELLADVGLLDVSVEVYGGPVSAWIDATKEFLSTILSLGSPFLYGLLSQALIIPFIPLRFLDLIARKSPVAKYTAFSFKATARKAGQPAIELAAPSVPDKTWLRDQLQVLPGFSLQEDDRVFWILSTHAQTP